MAYIGIIFALVALLCWGFGDFFIQKTSRKTGIVHALFYITAAGAIILFPFVWPDLKLLTLHNAALLLVTGIIIFIVALIEFQALKIGKLAVIEPIMSLELPITVLFASFLGSESLSLIKYVVIAFVFLGIFMTVTPHTGVLKDYVKRLERGTLLALISAGGMALFNFMLGYASQHTSPVMAQWSTSLVMALGCLIFMVHTGEINKIFKDFKKAKLSIIAETIFDNGAWLAYAFAVIYIPISIAITVSESYIILAVLLGVLINHERLKSHQYLGVAIAIAAVFLLSYLSGQ
jgi:drug/metabolite transporter (DMT)-like permease